MMRLLLLIAAFATASAAPVFLFDNSMVDTFTHGRELADFDKGGETACSPKALITDKDQCLKAAKKVNKDVEDIKMLKKSDWEDYQPGCSIRDDKAYVGDTSSGRARMKQGEKGDVPICKGGSKGAFSESESSESTASPSEKKTKFSGDTCSPKKLITDKDKCLKAAKKINKDVEDIKMLKKSDWADYQPGCSIRDDKAYVGDTSSGRARMAQGEKGDVAVCDGGSKGAFSESIASESTASPSEKKNKFSGDVCSPKKLITDKDKCLKAAKKVNKDVEDIKMLKKSDWADYQPGCSVRDDKAYVGDSASGRARMAQGKKGDVAICDGGSKGAFSESIASPSTPSSASETSADDDDSESIASPSTPSSASETSADDDDADETAADDDDDDEDETATDDDDDDEDETATE